MKKLVTCIIAMTICLLFACSFAVGFSAEQVAKSVLKLYVYLNENDEDYSATGSGFVAFDSNTLITNYHVIEDAALIFASDDEGNTYQLDKVLCADKNADIAILEFSVPTSLKPLELFASKSLDRGTSVVAIGSPKGLINTVSDGIVSYQFEEDGIPMIQITAPISPGSSGGALFNDNGKVIGVTTSVYNTKDEYGKDTGAQNLNFAVNIAVPKAMYKAWDGTRYTLKNHKTSARMDFSEVYEQEGTVSPVTAAMTEEKQDASSNEAWVCLNCGKENTSKFCLECGVEKPYWTCSCGKQNSSSKFCGECGSSRNNLLDSFNNAVSMSKRGEYAEAVRILESLGQFDSGSFETADGSHAVASSYIGKMYYDLAVNLQENGGDHDAIIEAFMKAGDYGDAREQIVGENARYHKAFYDAGIEQLKNGEYDAAIESFLNAGDYQDASSRINSVYFAKGNALMEAKDYEGAREAWGNLKEDKIIKGKINESYYHEAEDKLNEKAYDKAIELFGKAEGYSDADDRIKEVYYLLGEQALDEKETEKAKEYFTKAADYKDAQTIVSTIMNDEKESTYQAAVDAFNNGNYQEASDLFDMIPGYRDADTKKIKAIVADKTKRADSLINSDKPNRMALLKSDVLTKIKKYIDKDEEAYALYKRVSYEIAIDYTQKENYESMAIQYFEQAKDYLDTADQLIQCIGNYYERLIDKGQRSTAEDLYKKYVAEYKGLKDFVYIDVGSIGDNVTMLFELIKTLGIKTKGTNLGMLYLTDHIPYVKQIEEHFGLDIDGKITLGEYMEIRDALYSGSNSGRVSKLLEKLADLGYITGLPKDHLKYENRYLAGVKKAEKALGLQEDGIIVNSEYEKIMEQKVDAPERPKNLKSIVNNDTVTLTWSSVQGAVGFEVSCDGKILGTTENNRWTDKDVETGKTHNYSVVAKKHTVKSNASKISVVVPKYYEPINIATLINKGNSYAGKNVIINGIRLNDWAIRSPDGIVNAATSDMMKKAQSSNNYDLVLLCGSGDNKVVLIMENYKGWGWKDTKNDLIGVLNRVTDVTVKGIVLSRAVYSDMDMPVITVEHLSWNYR